MKLHKVTLDYNPKTGLGDIQELDQLQAPTEFVRKAKKNASKISRVTVKYRFPWWTLVLIAVGLAVALLSFFLVPFPEQFVGFGVGLVIALIPGIINCCLVFKKNKKLAECFESLARDTHGVIKVKPKYASRFAGRGRAYLVLTEISYIVNQDRLPTLTNPEN